MMRQMLARHQELPSIKTFAHVSTHMHARYQHAPELYIEVEFAELYVRLHEQAMKRHQLHALCPSSNNEFLELIRELCSPDQLS